MPLSTVNNGDTGLQARTAINAAISLLNIIKENVYKVTYYEIIAGANGSVTLPGQATINAEEFGLSGNAVLSEIDGSNKPTYVSPKTAGGVIVTASLNVLTGAWVKSGVTASANVAIIYSVNITEENYVNLDNNFIIETVESGKEDAIAAGTTAQYWRGDKTWQTLDKTAVGLSNVDNTTDAGKPVSTAQQTALNLKENSSNKDASGGYAGLTLFKINFRNVANTFTSFFTNTNTAARTYTYQDRNGTIADDTDLLAKANTSQHTLSFATTGFNPSTASTYYIGGNPAYAPFTTTNNSRRLVALKSGTITTIGIQSASGNVQNESGFSIAVKNVTTGLSATFIATFAYNIGASGYYVGIGTGNVVVTAGDQIEILYTTPAVYVTAPTGITVTGWILIQ